MERASEIEAAYQKFPDVIDKTFKEHPLGKIVQDNGNLRYAFIMGYKFAKEQK